MQSRQSKIAIYSFFFFIIFIIPALYLFLDPNYPLDSKNSELGKELKARNAAFDAYIGYLNEINRGFVNRMEQELGISSIGDMDRLSAKIEQMGLQFKVYRPATIPEARALILSLIEQYSHAINAHEKIRPFLNEYPFKHARIALSFQTRNNICSDTYVVHALNTTDTALEGNENKLFYDGEDPFTFERFDLLAEDRDEAIKINEINPVKNLNVHQTTDQEEALQHSFDQFVHEMRQTADFECWSIGEKNDQGIVEIGCYLLAKNRATLEQARELILYASSTLLQAINQNEKLKPFLKEPLFGADRLKMRLRFTDKWHIPFSDGSMEYVTLENNVLSYYHQKTEKEPWGESPLRTLLAGQETYPEAVKILEQTPPSKR